MTTATDGRRTPSDLSPSIPVDRTSGIGLAVLRIVVGITWLHEAAWKTPPEFAGLRDWTTRPLDNPTSETFNAVLEAVVLPNIAFFGWVTLLAEASLGAFLVVGLATRLWAVVGIAQGMAITLSVISVPGEWSYAYYLFVAAHVALLTGAGGRTFGIDGLLRDRWAAAEGDGPGGRLAWALRRAS
jgi:thiosulfate dehydrogenase (quinone) large subunit